MTPVEITAGRLHLRPWTPYDDDALLAVFTDPDTVRWSSTPHPFTPQEAHRRLTEVFPQGWEEGTQLTWAPVDAVSAQVLGWLGLFNIGNGGAEIGWATSPQARGGAVATESVAAVCRWAFQALGLEVVQAGIGVGNWASRAVAQKCGFTIEGVARKGMPQRGRRLDGWTATLLSTDEITDTRPLPRVPVLTDGVVTLRAFRPEDAADVARACDNPESARWLPAMPTPYRLEDGQFYVETIAPLGWADGTSATFAVTDGTTGELTGDISLKLTERQFGVGEIGYWTAPWARGRGVAGRATAVLAQWGLDVLGLHRIELLADVENAASQRAAEKAGFVREGISRAARPGRDARPRDMALYSIVRPEVMSR